MLDLLFENKACRDPLVSLVLIDWSCRESLHVLDYLQKQTLPRERFEIIWIEYYTRKAPKIEKQLREAKKKGVYPIVDKWIVMGLSGEYYYHKHIMYNIGIIAGRGKIVTIFDSDSIVLPPFVETIAAAFEEDSDIVLHMDQIRNYNKRFYPFNYPSPEDVLGEGVWNYKDGTTTGLLDIKDPLHSRNYGGCMSALREDLLAIGGADEHIDYMGHICGAYDMTFRLVNAGKKEVWHRDVLLYHVYHPGTEGEANYFGPHDGKYMSTLALESIRSGRVPPLDENPVVRDLRLGEGGKEKLEDLLARAVSGDKMGELKIDEAKQLTSRGRVCSGKGDFDGAIRCWEDALRHMSPNGVILNDLGWAYYMTSDFKEALRAFNECLALEAEHLRAALGRGWASFQLGAYDDAVRDFGTVAENGHARQDRDLMQESLRGRGWACLHLGRLEEAVRDLERAGEYTDDDNKAVLQDIFRGMGWAFNRMKEFERAGECFTRAIEFIDTPQKVLMDDALNGRREAQRGLSEAAREGGEGEKTAGAVSGDGEEKAPQEEEKKRESLENQLRLKEEILGNIGWAYYMKSNYDEAINAFNEALSLNPAHFRSLIGRGWIYLHKGTLDEAVADFDKAIEYIDMSEQNQLQEALRGRGWANYHKGRHGMAVNDFNEALELTAEGDENVLRHILRGRSWAYYRQGEVEKALEDFNKANNRDGSAQFLAKAQLSLQVIGSRVKNNFKKAFR